MILHKEKAAMLVSQTHPSRVELYFYATTSCRLGNVSMCKLIIFHIIVLFRSYLVVLFYNIGSSLFLRLRPDAPLDCILFISAKPFLCWAMRRFSLHDVTAAMLFLRNKEKAAMLVPQTPSTIEFLMLRISFRANDRDKQSVVFFFQPILVLSSILLLCFKTLVYCFVLLYPLCFFSYILLYGSISLQPFFTTPFFVRLQRKFLI